MKTRRGLVLVACLTWSCGDGSESDEGSPAALHCEVGIIGGGAAGVYTAYRLAPILGEGVCLFEKEATLGGRIRDVGLDDDPGSPRIAAGARRIMEGQEQMFALAAELGIQFETPEPGVDLINVGDRFAFSRDAFVPDYPELAGPLDDDPDTDRETELYIELMAGPARADVADYPDLQSYIRDVVGDTGLQFLHDMSRFRADFEVPIAAENYLAYFDAEWNNCCTPSYPVGGMGMFIANMADRVVADGGQIYMSEPVIEIDRGSPGYRLRTASRVITVEKLVLAVPPVGLDKIGGAVAEDIRARSEYQALFPVRVTVINQWWDEAWWKDVADPGSSATEPRIHRAWTTEHCVNAVEVPFEPYARAQKVLRSVYNDDPECVALWEKLLADEGIAGVEAEVLEGLDLLFNNGVAAPAMVGIPTPLKTEMQVWPGAWYYVRPGSAVTNQQITDWAVEPLPGEPDVMLASEAYWPQRTGWSDGAYRSADAILAAKFGVQVMRAATSRVPAARSRWAGGSR